MSTVTAQMPLSMKGLSFGQHQVMRAAPYSPPDFALRLSAGIIQSAELGTPYSDVITANGGTSPYTFSIASGSLPPGLSLNSSTGEISGTPTTAATYTFEFRVDDSASAYTSNFYSIIVKPRSSTAACIVY